MIVPSCHSLAVDCGAKTGRSVACYTLPKNRHPYWTRVGGQVIRHLLGYLLRPAFLEQVMRQN